MNDIGFSASRLKLLRDVSGKTQADVAQCIGLSRAAYSHLENGRNEPDSKTVVKLAKYYKVTTDYLLGLNVSKSKSDLIWDLIQDLTPNQKDEILNFIKKLKSQ